MDYFLSINRVIWKDEKAHLRNPWRWDSADPFGLEQPEQNPSRLGALSYNPRFPSQVFDNETNNNYNYFRDYDPQQGRYIQSRV
jgi:RHS repeat-associated protein